jgi:hypothetical protein
MNFYNESLSSGPVDGASRDPERCQLRSTCNPVLRTEELENTRTMKHSLMGVTGRRSPENDPFSVAIPDKTDA